VSKQMSFGQAGGLVEYKLRVDTSEAVEGFRELEQVALRYLVLARRLGLPDDVNVAMSVAARAVVTMRQLEQTIRMLDLAMAGSPMGWAMFAATTAFTAISFVDTIEMARSTR